MALLSLAALLVVIWLVAWLVFHTIGFAVHLLLLAAIALFVYWLVQRGRRHVGL